MFFFFSSVAMVFSAVHLGHLAQNWKRDKVQNRWWKIQTCSDCETPVFILGSLCVCAEDRWQMSVLASTTGRLVQPGGEVRRFGERAIAAADAAGGLSARRHQSHDPAPRGLQCLHAGCEEHTNTILNSQDDVWMFRGAVCAHLKMSKSQFALQSKARLLLSPVLIDH